MQYLLVMRPGTKLKASQQLRSVWLVSLLVRFLFLMVSCLPVFFLVCELVLKVLGVAEQEHVVVMPQPVEDPKPHEPSEKLRSEFMPFGRLWNSYSFICHALPT